MRQTLYTLTRQPHASGSDANLELANFISKVYSDSGLAVYKSNFTGFIKYPTEVSVEVKGLVNYKCKLKEECVPEDPTSCHPNITSPYIAYTGGGFADGGLVYVNYGREEDYAYLEQNRISVLGTIVIARYGHIFRGNKAHLAEKYGARGLLIYSDPADDAKGPVYPEGPWRAPTSIQGGSAHYLSLCPGDPLRVDICNVTSPEDLMPSIPVHALSYDDAQHLLMGLVKSPAPPSWQGGLPFRYNIQSDETTVEMFIKTNTYNASLVNVHGILRGEVTDKFLIVGAHRDAWSFGAVDPGSATSVITEVVKALGELYKKGWKPKRTIYFMSWDGEEQGQLGSSYWVESNENMLRSGALAYFNLDTAVSGPFFASSATPSLASMIRNATKFVNDPTLHEPIYNIWDKNVKILGSGSDFTSFLDYMGIPSSDIRYTSKYYGVYHSSYDSFHWMEKFGDPGFKRHKAVSQVLGLMIMAFSDRQIVPYNFTEYGQALTDMHKFTVDNLNSKNGSSEVSLNRLNLLIKEFLNTSIAVHNHVNSKTNLTNAASEKINDIFMKIERQFIGRGLPGRGYYKHVVQAPGLNTGYGAHVLPGINDSIDKKDWALANRETRVVEERVKSAETLLRSILLI